ncbi:MAG: hypothetical protein K2N80_10110 [Lachnospiraceae bacterium]|nr:hypothetical protein [Lachnospiraceae bacterium]
MKTMKKARKYLAFILAMGLMMSSMTVFAEETTSDETTSTESTTESTTEGSSSKGLANYYYYSGGIVSTGGSYWNTWYYYGSKPVLGDGYADGDYWYNPETKEWKEYNKELSAWVKEGYRAVTAEEYQAMVDRAAAEAYQAEAEDEGFTDVAQMQYAQAAHKNAGEYYNNAVVTTPGIEEAVPVAQGGKLVIDGEVTNATASISKVTVAYVDSVRATQEGRVLNVVDVRFPAVEATINFYMPGVVEGMNVVALQYEDGVWTNVDVAEVRADHVVLNMKGNGVVAFVAK